MDDLEIRLKLNKDEADRAAKEFHESEKKRQAEGKAAAQEAEQAKTQAATTEGTRRQRDADAAHRRDLERPRELSREEVKQAEASAEAQKRIRDRAVAAADAAVKRAMESSRQSFDLQKEQARVLADSIKSSAGVAVGVLAAISDTYRRAAEQARRAAKETAGFRGELLQLAHLHDTPGGTTEELRKHVAVAGQTGLGLADVRQLATGAEPGEAGFANQAEFQEALKRAGQYAAVGGMSADQAGAALGFLGEMGQDLTADRAESELVRLEKLGVAGHMGGAAGLLDRMREQRDLISEGRLTTGEAGGLLAQFGAGRRGGATRLARSAIDAVSSEGVADYLQTLGAGDGSALDQIKAISDDLARAQAQGVGDLGTYLEDRGIADPMGRSSLLEFHKGRDRFDKTIAPLIQGDFSGDIGERFGERVNDPAIRQGMVEAAGQMASITVGEQSTFAEQMRSMAYARMQAEGRALGSREEYDRDRGLPSSLGELAPTALWSRYGPNAVNQTKLNVEAGRMLEEQMKAAGLDMRMGTDNWQMLNIAKGQTAMGGGAGPAPTPLQIDQAMNTIGERIAAAGGQSLPGLDTFAEGANKILQAAQINAANAQRTPPPLQGAPQQPPAAPR